MPESQSVSELLPVACLTSTMPFNCDDYSEFFRTNGYSVFPRVLGSPHVQILRDAIDAVPDSAAVHRKQNVYGVRNLFDASAAVRSLTSSPVVRQFVTPILGDD